MITNDVCTIIRLDDNEDYQIVGCYPCMWQETEGYEVKKYGEENADKAAIYIPDLSADVKKGDTICRGKITEVENVDGMLTVMSLTRHNYGSADMQHVKIGAR